jgi:uncharacterized membrane-anchored protein
MSEKRNIKVVKKSERQPKVTLKPNSASQTAREMVKTVTNWVNDLQQKRTVETAHAVKILLTKTRPSEA